MTGKVKKIENLSLKIFTEHQIELEVLKVTNL